MWMYSVMVKTETNVHQKQDFTHSTFKVWFLRQHH